MLQQQKKVGVRGLHLGADPTQLADGYLTIADGVRYIETGAAHSRGGRVLAGLSFPNEGYAAAGPYIEEIPHFIAPGNVRGFAAFYDQRIVFNNDGTKNIPQRLNFIYKADTRLYFNHNYVGDGSGILTGSGTFANTSKAKIVVSGDRVYIVDGVSYPKVLRRSIDSEQLPLTRVKYSITSMGIPWPTASTQVPIVTDIFSGTTTIPAGAYRFKIALEDKFGIVSNPSLLALIAFYTDLPNEVLHVDWSAIESTFPSSAIKVRVYVSFVDYSGAVFGRTPQTEPSAFVYVTSVDITGSVNTYDFTRADFDKVHSNPLMSVNNGTPPPLVDLAIVNDVGFAIPASGTIYREGTIGDANLRIVGNPAQEQFPGFTSRLRAYDNGEIKKVDLDSSYLMWSKPGEPQYMEYYVRVGNNSEICVGLATLGHVCVVFTNQSIYTFDSVDLQLKRVFAKAGALSRDAIVETEQGIRFIGSDGVPRLFNGATVEEVATELLPLFDRDDYLGDYNSFDRSRASEVSATSGDRRFFMTLPVSHDPATHTKPGAGTELARERHFVIGDASRGPTQWSIDRGDGYSFVYWLGRESRLLGVNPQNAFYFLEEGLTDEVEEDGQDYDIFFDLKARRMAGANGMQGQFYKAAIDVDTKGQSLTLAVQVDQDPELQIEFVVNTAGRDEFKTYLPAKFKGRYIDLRLTGFTSDAKRIALYGLYVESATRGEF